MKRMVGILMVVGLVVGVLSGCGKEIEVVKKTQPITGILIEEYEVYRDDKSNKPIKHGYYKSYYEDGSYKDVGQYEDGYAEGKYVWYYKSGVVGSEGNYVDGKAEGKEVGYYKSGEVKEERNYVDGKLDGKWVLYYEDGKIAYEYCYRNGEKVDLSLCE